MIRKRQLLAAVTAALLALLAGGLLPAVMPAAAAAPTQKEASAMETNQAAQTLSYEGYTLRWQDEFDGTALNREDWNVELHEPGWVNNELQSYVDSPENIYLTPRTSTTSNTVFLKPAPRCPQDRVSCPPSG